MILSGGFFPCLAHQLTESSGVFEVQLGSINHSFQQYQITLTHVPDAQRLANLLLAGFSVQLTDCRIQERASQGTNVVKRQFRFAFLQGTRQASINFLSVIRGNAKGAANYFQHCNFNFFIHNMS